MRGKLSRLGTGCIGRTELKEGKDFFPRQAAAWRSGRFVENSVEKLALALKHFIDALFNRIQNQKACYRHGTLHSNSMRSIDRLVLDGRIPPSVEKKYIIRELQIKPNSASTIAHQYHMAIWIVPKLGYLRVAVPTCDFAVIFHRPEPSQPAA